MNTVNLTGNICNDLEIKQTSTGKSVVLINLAVKRPHVKDTTDFIPVVVWGQSAEFLNTYAHKGSKIEVTGKLTSRNWEDKDGNKRTSYEVIADTVGLLDSRSDSAQPTPPSPQTAEYTPVEGDDDLPF